MSVGARVRELRQKKGEREGQKITQDHVARAIGVKALTISRLERGETEEPDTQTVRGLASYFGVTVDYLLEGRDSGESQSGARPVYRPRPAAGRGEGTQPQAGTTTIELNPDGLPKVWLQTLRSGRLGEVSEADEAAAIAFCTSPSGGANEGGLEVDDLVDFIETLRARRAGRLAREPERSIAGAEETAAVKARGAAKGHARLRIKGKL
jgi:transcriptional regulator with XRE-family HTH domain